MIEAKGMLMIFIFRETGLRFKVAPKSSYGSAFVLLPLQGQKSHFFRDWIFPFLLPSYAEDIPSRKLGAAKKGGRGLKTENSKQLE